MKQMKAVMIKNLCALCMVSLLSFAAIAQGQDYSTHVVEKGQTLYAISKIYGVSVDQIKAANSNIGEGFMIDVGDELKIPMKSEPVVKEVEAPKDLELEPQKYVYHQVEKGQTLYSISKQYKDMSVEWIMAHNDMVTTDISEGDWLIVGELDERAMFDDNNDDGKKKKKNKKNKDKNEDKNEDELAADDDELTEVFMDDELVLAPVETAPKVEVAKANDYSSIFAKYADNGSLSIAESKGVAKYLDQNSSSNVYYALYNDASIGSVLKVRNLMNNKVVYLKVIGQLPEIDQQEDILIKLSWEAARTLNVLDDKFLVEVVAYK